MGEAIVNPGHSPETALSEHQEARDKAALLARLLGRLPEAQRAAFVLFEIEGYSGEQIAEFQDAPLNTVWARIRKARLTLLKHGQRLRRLEGRG